jgi:hypothetical protein
VKAADALTSVNRLMLVDLRDVPTPSDSRWVWRYIWRPRTVVRLVILAFVTWLFWPGFTDAARGNLFSAVASLAVVGLVAFNTVIAYRNWLFAIWFDRCWRPAAGYVQDEYFLRPFRVTSWSERPLVGTVAFSAVIHGAQYLFELPADQVKRVGVEMKTVVFLAADTDVTESQTSSNRILRRQQLTGGFWLSTALIGQFDSP